MLKILGQSDPDLQRYLRHTQRQTDRQTEIPCFYRAISLSRHLVRVEITLPLHIQVKHTMAMQYIAKILVPIESDSNCGGGCPEGVP